MVKRIDDLGNVKGSKPAKQNDRVQRAESSAREPKSSKSAVVLTKATEKLFAVADTPEKISKLSIKKLEKLIYNSGYYKNKAKTI